MDPSALSAQPPVFVLASEDAIVVAFHSVEEAESYVERKGEDDGQWRWWDGHGRVLVASRRVEEGHSRTRLVVAGEAEPDALRWWLLRSLRLVGVRHWVLGRLPFADLCEFASHRLQVPRSRWSRWRPTAWLWNRPRRRGDEHS